MAKIADILIKISADTYSLQQKTAEATSSISVMSAKMQKSLASIGKTMSVALTLPLALYAKAAIANADAQAKAEAKIQSALNATGNAAGITAKQLGEVATRLQSKTLYGDDEILTGVTAKLLSFKNITGQTLIDTQKLVLDFATMMGQDASQAAVTLGKSLNDPVRGLTQLRRVGIQFTAAQQEQIKAMSEAGDVADAQRIMIAALNATYGGQAEAAAKTGAGAIQQMKIAWGELAESVGKVLMPAFTSFASSLKSVFEYLQNLDPIVIKIASSIGLLLAAVGPLSLAFVSLNKTLVSVSTAGPVLLKMFTTLVSPIGLVIASITTLSVLIYKMSTAMTDAQAAQSRLTSAYNDTNKATIEELGNLNRLSAELSGAKKGSSEWLKAKESIITQYGKYLPNLSSEIDKVGNLSTTYNTLAKSIKNSIAARQYQTFSKNEIDNYDKTFSKTIDSVYNKLIKKYGDKGLDFYEEFFSIVSGQTTKISAEAAKAFSETTAGGMSWAHGGAETISTKIERLKELSKTTENNIKKFSDKYQLSATSSNGVSVSSTQLFDTSEQINTSLDKRNEKLSEEAKLLEEIRTSAGKRLDAEINGLPKIAEITDTTSTPTVTSANSFTPQNRISNHDYAMQWSADYGLSNGLSGEQIGSTADAIEKLANKMQKGGKSYSEKVNTVGRQIEQANEQFNGLVKDSLKSAFISIGEGIGNLISGDMGIGGVLSSFKSLIGNALVQLGNILIELGVEMMGIKAALKAAFSNPILAIAAGVAAIAAGTILINTATKQASDSYDKTTTSVALANGGLVTGATVALVGDNPNARTDPELVTPLSKLKDYIGNRAQDIRLTIDGELTASGRGLSLALKKENVRLKTLGV